MEAMMETTNLKELQDVILDAAKTREATTDFATVTIPKDYQIEDLEQFQTERNQFRGKFRTNRIGDFKDYCDKLGHEDDICFVDPEKVSAQVIFDMGTENAPGHCLHTAKLNLVETAAYCVVLGLGSQSFTQKGLFNFMQDWKNNITVLDANGEEIVFTTAAQNVLSIDIEETLKSGFEETDFSAERSSMAKIEAKAKAGKVLPAGFLFTTKPYLPLTEKDFYLRLSLSKAHSGPAFTLRCEGLEDIQEQIIDEFDNILTEEFGDRVIKGNFSS